MAVERGEEIGFSYILKRFPDGMMGEMREIKEAKGFGEWDRCPVASKCPRDSPVNTRVWADGYKGLWSSNSRLPHPKMQVGTSTSLALLAAPLLMWPGVTATA